MAPRPRDTNAGPHNPYARPDNHPLGTGPHGRATKTVKGGNATETTRAHQSGKHAGPGKGTMCSDPMPPHQQGC